MGLKELFLPLLGNWTGVEEHAEAPWVPAGQARAMLVFKLDVADQIVVQDYRQVRTDGREFTGHGVFVASDGGTPMLAWWFFDSSGQPPVPALGEWQDTALVLRRTTRRGQEEHRFDVDEDALRYRIDLRFVGRPEPLTFLAGRYRRVSGH